jgi:ATP-binding cassette, subfamily C, bacterial CydC
LDEPTEGLDSDTEGDVFDAISVFAHNKAIIMVTHREAGLGLVDVVYQMEHGVTRVSSSDSLASMKSFL